MLRSPSYMQSHFVLVSANDNLSWTLNSNPPGESRTLEVRLTYRAAAGRVYGALELTGS